MGLTKKMNDEFDCQIEEIDIPENVKTLPIAYFDLPIRLENVLRRLNVESLGDLHGMWFGEIESTRNCGRKTINELKDFINKLQKDKTLQTFEANFRQHLESVEKNNAVQALLKKIDELPENLPDNFIKTLDGKMFIPQSAREISLECFALSVRLGNVLDQFDIKTLADLEKHSLKEIRQAKNCGGKTWNEFQTVLIRIQKASATDELPQESIKITPAELNLNELLKFINRFLDDLPDREREIILGRFGGEAEAKVLTLEEVGEKFNVTRERVRQLESKNLKALKNGLTSVSESALEKIKTDCAAAVCPLTPRFLIYLTNDDFALFEYPPEFYLRLLNYLSPDIPIYTGVQTRPSNKITKEMKPRIKTLLDEFTEFVSLAELFNRLSFQFASDGAVLMNFFAVIQSHEFIIENGDSADVLLIASDKNRLTMGEVVRQVLEKSEIPLTPEEIIKRAREMFGAETDLPSARSIANISGYEKDIYLLDRKSFGLKKHFRLPEESWETVKIDFHQLLVREKRPISTTEVVGKNLFEWTRQTTASEATEILREDERFKDLGRFLFVLAEWQIEEREPIKNLIVRVLEESDKPLTATEIGREIQNYRSIAATSMPTFLRQHTEIITFDLGYYGLKSKGKYREFFTTDRKFLNRFLKNTAPQTFAELCRKLKIADDDADAQLLWAALQMIPKLRFTPNYYLPETIISYKK